MVDVEAILEHRMLAGDHVVVVVVREVHAQAVGGLARLAVANVIGEDKEEFGDIEGLAWSEEGIGEFRGGQRVGIAAGAVKQEDGVVDVACGVAMRGAQGDVVKPEL
jgi:hypothetical protein